MLWHLFFVYQLYVGGGVYFMAASIRGWHLIHCSGLRSIIRTINKSSTRQFRTLTLSFTYIVVPTTFVIVGQTYNGPYTLLWAWWTLSSGVTIHHGYYMKESNLSAWVRRYGGKGVGDDEKEPPPLQKLREERIRSRWSHWHSPMKENQNLAMS